MLYRDEIYVGDYGTTLTEPAPDGVAGTVTWQAESVRPGSPSIEASASIVDGQFVVTLPEDLIASGHIGTYQQSWQVVSGDGSATYPQPDVRRYLVVYPDPTENGAGVVVPLDPTVGSRLTSIEDVLAAVAAGDMSDTDALAILDGRYARTGIKNTFADEITVEDTSPGYYWTESDQADVDRRKARAIMFGGDLYFGMMNDANDDFIDFIHMRRDTKVLDLGEAIGGTVVADATGDTHAVNRQTGDGRWTKDQYTGIIDATPGLVNSWVTNENCHVQRNGRWVSWSIRDMTGGTDTYLFDTGDIPDGFRPADTEHFFYSLSELHDDDPTVGQGYVTTSGRMRVGSTAPGVTVTFHYLTDEAFPDPDDNYGWTA